jgi:hypothetical protein
LCRNKLKLSHLIKYLQRSVVAANPVGLIA